MSRKALNREILAFTTIKIKIINRTNTLLKFNLIFSSNLRLRTRTAKWDRTLLSSFNSLSIGMLYGILSIIHILIGESELKTRRVY